LAAGIGRLIRIAQVLFSTNTTGGVFLFKVLADTRTRIAATAPGMSN
jgi:hypothetical protein